MPNEDQGTRRRGPNDGSIYKDGKRWVAAVTIPSGIGLPLRRRRYSRTYAEARTKLKELQDELAAGVSASGRLTVGAYMGQWLEVQRASSRSPNTIAVYEWAIDRHLKPAFGKTQIQALSANQVEDLLISMAKNGASHSTMMRVRATLAMVLNEAERRGLVIRNVAALTSTPAGPMAERRSLTAEQARRLLGAAKGDFLGAAWTTLLLLGLRPGEVLGLKWEDIDFNKGTVDVRRSLKREPAGLRLGDPKTPKSKRTLDAPRQVLASLKAHRKRQASSRLLVGSMWEELDLVFTTSTGGLIDPNNFRRSLKTLTEGAGLGAWHPTELRHSAVSLLSAAGVPLEQVADVMGHATTRMTQEVYRHHVSPTVSAAKVPMEALASAESKPSRRAARSAKRAV
jgi:integrase